MTTVFSKPISTELQDLSEAVGSVSNLPEGKSVTEAISDLQTSFSGLQSGKIDKSDAISNIHRSGSDFIATKGDGTTTTLNLGLENVDNTSDLNKPISTATQTALDNKLDSSLKGQAHGLAELDEYGKVPQSQLPSYVDDVMEFSSRANFPLTGESDKIYVDLQTNLTYRWGGSEYIEISSSLALGTTSETAFRGDFGQTAYEHATAKGSSFASGLYKITTNSEGHVTDAYPVAKADITSLGVPEQDTTYTLMKDQTDGHVLLFGATGTEPQRIITEDTTYQFTDNDPLLDWGSQSAVATVGGTEIHVRMPANPNTDTSVTSSENHYTPTPDSQAVISADATGAATAWGIDVVRGVSLDTDGKGHVTGINLTSGKIPSLGTTSGTAAEGNHVHTTTIATSVSASQINLQPSTVYEINAGGTHYVFQTPTDTTYTPITNAEIDAIFA